MDVTFFLTPAEFREWLEANHDKAGELWLGFYKKGSGKTGITYAQAVDEALCFGWIDGIRKSLDAASYTNRFTPRRPGSVWSNVNINRVHELIELGLMRPSGLAEFNKRDEGRARQYSYERENAELDEPYQERFQANKQAWDFFQAQAPSYCKLANWWVMSARKEETRQRRLDALIEGSEQGMRLPQLLSPSRKS
ncbi:MAG: YdeI/OmpD-associated family protein [Chloroflexia bacterium]